MSQTSSRVGKLREDAYFSELDQQLLADLHELMVEAGEAVRQEGDEKLEHDRLEALPEAAVS
jgi:hypothetical protein